MFSYKWFQANQPIDYTGFFRHMLLWLTSSLNDSVYENPRYIQPKGGKGVAVYYVHGTADRSNAFSLIAQRILCSLPHGISKMYLTAFEKRGRGISIEEFAEQLLKKIKTNQDDHIILVGHSRGGLVASYFTENLAEPNIHVHSVITIGTPFLGSDFACGPLSVFSNSVKQMQKESEFLTELGKKIKTTKTTYFNFAAAKDGLVSLQSACFAAKTENTKILERHAHVSALSSHVLVEDLTNFITKIIESAKEKFPELGQQDDAKTPITKACLELKIALNSLNQRWHLSSQNKKVIILTVLKEKLKDCTLDNAYHASTIGEFINAFLQDPTILDKTKPIKILGEQLNPSCYFFSKEKPDSLVFIEKIIEQFKEVSIPGKEPTPQNTLRKSV